MSPSDGPMTVPTKRRESLCPLKALPLEGWRPAPPRRALPLLHRSYGLMRQSQILHSALLLLLLVVFTGCYQPLLEVGPSRRYPRNPCIGAWTHTPGCPSGALTRFFPEGNGLASSGTRSAHPSTPCNAASTGNRFRGCSHSLMFRLPCSLGLPAAPTAESKILGGQAPYTTQNSVRCLPEQWHHYVSDPGN